MEMGKNATKRGKMGYLTAFQATHNEASHSCLPVGKH
jgi:hypothetical protein